MTVIVLLVVVATHEDRHSLSTRSTKLHTPEFAGSIDLQQQPKGKVKGSSINNTNINDTNINNTNINDTNINDTHTKEHHHVNA